MVDNQQDNSTDLVLIENQDSTENKSENQIEKKENDDEFIRITAAHQMLTEAKTYEEEKDYSSALQLYRICVDFLLEELMFTEGTEQSRIYLREKCTALMDHIDLLKTKLEPLPTNSTPPIDQLKSLEI